MRLCFELLFVFVPCPGGCHTSRTGTALVSKGGQWLQAARCRGLGEPTSHFLVEVGQENKDRKRMEGMEKDSG